MLQVNGLADAGPEIKAAGTTIGFRGDRQHSFAHGQFFGQETVPHPFHQAIPVCRQLCCCRSVQNKDLMV